MLNWKFAGPGLITADSNIPDKGYYIVFYLGGSWQADFAGNNETDNPQLATGMLPYVLLACENYEAGLLLVTNCASALDYDESFPLEEHF